MNKVGYDFLLLGVAAIWGMGFVATDIAMEQLPPILITAVRFSLAALLFYIFAGQKKLLKQARLHWAPGLLVGLFLALGFIFQTVALRYTTPAKNAFLTSTNVIMAPFIYLIFTRRPLKTPFKTFGGAVLALAGITFLNSGNLRIGNTGDLLTLVCAFFFALHIYFTGYYLRERHCDLEAMVLLQFISAAAISWVLVLFLERVPLGVFSLQSLLAVLYLGIFSTMLCFFLQNFAQRKVNQNKVAIILSSEALFGTLFSVWLRAEVLTHYMLLGFSLMFCAILLTELPSRKLGTGKQK